MLARISSKQLDEIVELADKAKQIQSDIDVFQNRLKLENSLEESKRNQTVLKDNEAAIRVAKVEQDKSLTQMSKLIEPNGNAKNIFDTAIKSDNFYKTLATELQKCFIFPPRAAFALSNRKALKTASYIALAAAIILAPIIFCAPFGAVVLAANLSIVAVVLVMTFCATLHDVISKKNQQRQDEFLNKGRGAVNASTYQHLASQGMVNEGGRSQSPAQPAQLPSLLAPATANTVVGVNSKAAPVCPPRMAF